MVLVKGHQLKVNQITDCFPFVFNIAFFKRFLEQSCNYPTILDHTVGGKSVSITFQPSTYRTSVG